MGLHACIEHACGTAGVARLCEAEHRQLKECLNGNDDLSSTQLAGIAARLTTRARAADTLPSIVAPEL